MMGASGAHPVELGSFQMSPATSPIRMIVLPFLFGVTLNISNHSVLCVYGRIIERRLRCQNY